jgi:predicted MPP superfamily phosphohydrolase
VYSMGLILSIATCSSVIYGALFGKKDLVVNQIELEFPNLPQNYNGFTILHISDIHLGNFINSKKLLYKVKTETEEINPDIILFTGDLVNNFSNELKGWDGIFREITKDRDSFSILGNHDYGDYTDWKSETAKIENFQKIISSHETFGFKLLNNEHIKLKSGTDSMYIIGVENWGRPPFPQYANLEKAMTGIPENTFKILLSHDPAHWEQIIKNIENISLTLSGHTHGLQWGIKKAGITFSLIYLTRENWGGLYKYGNSLLYVNTGLGTVGIPWRINMPCELTVITLKRIEID